VFLEVRERHLVNTARAEADWPLPGTRYEALQLDAASGALLADAPHASHVDVTGDGAAVFDFTFGQDTELIGNAALKLHVSTQDQDDIDLFVGLEKLTADGTKVGFPFQSLYDDGPVALGWLRASHRELDPVKSTEAQPWHTHTRQLPVQRGEVIDVEVEILPSATLFRAGETLRLIVQGCELYPYWGDSVVIHHGDTANTGTFTVHTGGEHASRLVLPVLSGGLA
jgi:putative CocE/NonD family hydrolase